MILTKNLKKEYSDKYYTSIDELPIWNWWQVSETGDLKYLCKDGFEEAPSVDVWTKIHDEYLESYGLNDEFKKLLRLKKDWILKQSKFIVEGDAFSSTLADITEHKINDIINSGSKMSKEDVIIFLEEKLGREIDPKKLTVKKYNDYLKYYSKK